MHVISLFSALRCYIATTKFKNKIELDNLPLMYHLRCVLTQLYYKHDRNMACQAQQCTGMQEYAWVEVKHTLLHIKRLSVR